MLKIEKISKKDISLLCEKANEVWREHYANLLSETQIDYMLAKFQNPQSVEKQMQEGYEYYFLRVDGEVGGYIGIKNYSDYLYLSKFYILKDYRSKGYGRKAFSFLINLAQKAGLKRIQLNVNKDNESSIKVYEKLGFIRYNSAVRDIGNGFVMDDYDYEYIIK